MPKHLLDRIHEAEDLKKPFTDAKAKKLKSMISKLSKAHEHRKRGKKALKMRGYGGGCEGSGLNLPGAGVFRGGETAPHSEQIEHFEPPKLIPMYQSAAGYRGGGREHWMNRSYVPFIDHRGSGIELAGGHCNTCIYDQSRRH